MNGTSTPQALQSRCHNSCPKSDSDSIPLVTDDIPDGGLRAWLVVLGSFLSLFASFGVVNSYGVFQEYYSTVLLPDSPRSIISLIGALQLFCLYGLSPIVGKIFDAYGSQYLLPLGSLIATVSLAMVSLAQQGQTYQLFLSQGVMFGIGNAFILTPALAVLGHWFRHRRAYAIGIAASGSSFGGLCFPVVLQRLIPLVGFGWAVRITTFVALLCLVVSCLTIRTRLPLKGHVSLVDSVDFGGFKEWNYSLAGISAFFIFYALFVPYFYVETFANHQGVAPEIAKYQLAILNAFGIPARIIPGLLADRFGSLNILLPSTMISGILILGLWLPAKSAIPITLFSASYGLFSGSFTSLLPAYIATVSPVDKLGARLGAIYVIIAVAGLAGTPTAGAFIQTVDQAHFNRLIVFSGVFILTGGIVVGAARLVHARRVPNPIDST